MPVSSTLNANAQKGTVSLLVPLIIAVVVIGGFFLINKNSTNPTKAPQSEQNPQVATNTISPSPSIKWETYKDEKYGYSLKRPQGWTVENLSSENTRLTKVTAADQTAFVLIDGITGPSLEKEGELEKVMNLLEDKLRKNDNIKVANFTRTSENDMSGYLATGEETYSGKTIQFEERFIVWKNGRGLRLHSGYAPDSKEINQPITAEIMSSFTTD